MRRIHSRNRSDADGDYDGKPWVIGVTGPPGAGKSTLLNRLITASRAEGKRVAALAVDPSSPLTGGALLGDRIRMGSHSGDREVYIRSMASRGYIGGLSAAVIDGVRILAAAGFDEIFIESVGVGQSEVGILSAADVVLLVLTPGSGDEVQALKAGVLEIGDLYVVNKADQPGTDLLERELQYVCNNSRCSDVTPVTARTIAITGAGVDDLYAAVLAQIDALKETGEIAARRQARTRDAVIDVAVDSLRRWLSQRSTPGGFDNVPMHALRRGITDVLDKLESEYGEKHDRVD